MRYLFAKFPAANSGELSWARSRAVCSPALAWVAVQKLGIQRTMLINNQELSHSISHYVPVLLATSSKEIIHKGWKYEPPKVLSDVFESIIGAILVDSVLRLMSLPGSITN